MHQRGRCAGNHAHCMPTSSHRCVHSLAMGGRPGQRSARFASWHRSSTRLEQCVGTLHTGLDGTVCGRPHLGQRLTAPPWRPAGLRLTGATYNGHVCAQVGNGRWQISLHAAAECGELAYGHAREHSSIGLPCGTICALSSGDFRLPAQTKASACRATRAMARSANAADEPQKQRYSSGISAHRAWQAGQRHDASVVEK